jgi:tight adherence protein C
MPVLPIFVALFLALTVLVFFVAAAVRVEPDPLAQRLAALNQSAVESLEQLELQEPFFERAIRPLSRKLSRRGGKSKEADAKIAKLDRRLAMAGNPGGLRASEFSGFKAIWALCIMIAVFLIFGVLIGNLSMGVMGGLVSGFIGYILPSFWLGRRIKGRQKKIVLQLPDALDLITISVRAGLGFDAALAKVVEKMEGPLIDEFRRALAEVRVGKTRREALTDITERTDADALHNFINAILQAEQLGVSVSKVLTVQSDQLRVERRQKAEESAGKAPIKMLFPLIGCIFPSLFIVLLGPAVIMIVNNLGSTNLGK